MDKFYILSFIHRRRLINGILLSRHETQYYGDLRLKLKKMIEALKTDIHTRFSSVPSGRLKIAATGTFEKEADAIRWQELVQSAFPDASVCYMPLSCSIACHVGIDATGIGVSVIDKSR